MLGKTNAVSGGKQKYGAYNIEEVEVDGGVVLEITDADEKPVDKIQLRCDRTQSLQYAFAGSEWRGSGARDLIYEMLDGVDTSNVTNMAYMFSKASYLSTTADVPLYLNINTSNVVNMAGMFRDCFNLRYIDVSNFDTSKVTTMAYMFYNSGIYNIDLSSFDTSSNVSLEYMFAECDNMLNVKGVFDISTTDITGNMFYNCRLLENINIQFICPNPRPNVAIGMSSMFSNCMKLKEIDLTAFSKILAGNIYAMFNSCYELEKIEGILDLYNCSQQGSAFYLTYALTGVTLKNIRKSLQIGSGTSYGHLWQLPYLVNAIKELWDLTGSTQQTLTIGSANLEKIANVYVKLVEVTDEMIAADEYAANKLPCIECESTDEGAMTLTAYAGLKNWGLA
jgi:surface protein